MEAVVAECQHLSETLRKTMKMATPYSSQTYRHVPITLYRLLNVAPDDGLMIVRNM